MMTTKELMKKLEKKNCLWLMWAVVWRWFTTLTIIYITIFFLGGILVGLLGRY